MLPDPQARRNHAQEAGLATRDRSQGPKNAPNISETNQNSSIGSTMKAEVASFHGPSVPYGELLS
jgi:hypothetical protein